MFWSDFLVPFFILTLSSSTWAAIRMSQPKILLPYHPRIETNFTLEATDGCFLWSTSRSDLIHIESLPPKLIKNGQHCSLRANIIAHTKQSLRSSATIYARDILSGQSVRCDVIIDKIQTIEIVYTTTRLYLEDAPELFKLRAYDQHGSTFSSIDNFPYEWRLLNAVADSSRTLDATKVIRILRLTDSSYEMSETVRDLESHGSLSYEILLEGLRTGSALVQAEIIDTELYHGIRTKPVRLSVSANVQLYPSTDLYLLPYSRLAFRLLQIKRQESTDITDLPSTRILYEVKLINTDAGQLDEQTLIFTATDHADEQSRLELIDRNMKTIDVDAYEPISLTIHIVNIGYLSGVSNASRPWIFQVGSFYLVTLEMFDVNGRRIYSTDNLDLSIRIPHQQHQTCLTLTSLHQNGTQYILRPNCPGRFELEFSLHGIRNQDQLLDIPITATAQQSFDVYLPLTVQPKRVLLPEKTTTHIEFDSNHCPIKVFGGSGDYIWSSQDTNVVTVSSTGHLMAQTSLNTTFVDVIDLKSPEMNASVHIQVVQPDEFRLVPCPIEIELHSILHLPMQLFYKKQFLSCCSHLDFDIMIDNHFQYQGTIPSSPDNTDKICAWLVFKPLKSGLANLRVTLKKYALQQTLVLNAYEPLMINRHPHLLLGIDSQFHLKLSQGPWSFSDQQQQFKYEILPNNTHIQFEQDISNRNLLHIQCRKQIRQQSFDISKQNPMTIQNSCPAKSTVTIEINCEPTIASLILEPIYDENTLGTQCPRSKRGRILAYFDEILPIKVSALDDRRVVFDNFTSFKSHCALKPDRTPLAELLHSSALSHRINSHDDSDIAFVEIQPKRLSGNVTLICRTDSIEQQIEIEFVSNVQFDHDIKLLYMTEPSLLTSIPLKGGSGHFRFKTNEQTDDELIRLSMRENDQRTLLIKPIKMGQTTLMIVDQCLPLSSSKIEIIVADLEELRVFGRSRLAINSSSLLFVQALDSAGHFFDLIETRQLMHIHIQQQPEILILEYEPQSNPDDRTIAYRVQTKEIGRTNLIFHSTRVKSQTIEFEVFPPLRIDPKQLTVLPLSTIQLTIVGGSQMPGTTIEWSTNDPGIVELQANNIFKTKQIGKAIIRAKSIGIDPLLGKSVIYGEDSCSIRVVRIHSIHLHVPNTEFLPGKFVPLIVLPLDNEKTPILFTDVFLHSLVFTWSLSNIRLAQFRPLIGNLSTFTRTFVTNLETFHPGRIIVDVRLSSNSKNLDKLLLINSRELFHSIELTILEPFHLDQFGETRTILLGSNSRLHLIHIPNDMTLELSSSSTSITWRADSHTLESDNNQFSEAILYMKYRGKSSSSSSIVGAYLVQVKPIHYILLQSYLPAETSTLFSSIPVDYKLPLSVSYHDELGRRFDATSISLRTFSHRYDMILSNSNNSHSFEIIPLKNGSNILVFDGGIDDHLRAYLPIQANSGFLLPKSSITSLKQSYTIGDIVCFESNLSNDENNSDRWNGDDGMYIDSKYGIGQMIVDGERHLHLNIDGQTMTSERFHVQLPNEIKLFKGNKDFLYDGEQDQPYLYPVIFGSGSTNVHGSCQREGLEHAQSTRVLRPPFECRLEFMNSAAKQPKASSLFDTRAVFGLDLMSWACRIESVPSHHHHHSSTHDDSLRLLVHTPWQISSNELIIPYQPSFTSSSSLIHLSEEYPRGHIQISTLPNNARYLQVRSSDSSVVHVEKNTSDPFVFNIELRHGAKTNGNDPLFVEIKNLLTGQEERVSVKLQKRFIDNPIGRILASLLLCASLALIIYGLANRQPSTTASIKHGHVQPVSSSSPRVLLSPPTPKRHTLFEDHRPTSTPLVFDTNASVTTSSTPTTTTHHNDQPVVRLYSAQDLRSRSIAGTPRSAISSMTLPVTGDNDLSARLQRLYE